QYPKTIINAKVDPIEGESRDKLLVTGNVLLRGIERGIQFRADVTDDNDVRGVRGVRGVRFHAVFDMSRSAFNIHAGPGEGDALIRDDFTVTFDFHATPEQVRAEEMPDTPPPQSGMEHPEVLVDE